MIPYTADHTAAANAIEKPLTEGLYLTKQPNHFSIS